jgi:hypothetical protein
MIKFFGSAAYSLGMFTQLDFGNIRTGCTSAPCTSSRISDGSAQALLWDQGLYITVCEDGKGSAVTREPLAEYLLAKKILAVHGIKLKRIAAKAGEKGKASA